MCKLKMCIETARWKPTLCHYVPSVCMCLSNTWTRLARTTQKGKQWTGVLYLNTQWEGRKVGNLCFKLKYAMNKSLIYCCAFTDDTPSFQPHSESLYSLPNEPCWSYNLVRIAKNSNWDMLYTLPFNNSNMTVIILYLPFVTASNHPLF